MSINLYSRNQFKHIHKSIFINKVASAVLKACEWKYEQKQTETHANDKHQQANHAEESHV